MKKKYDNGMLITELSADGKIIHFSLKVTDLKKLFKYSPENYDGSNIKRGKERDFVDYILNRLSEPSTSDENSVKWLIPFEEIFLEILEGYEDFVTYKEN